MKNKLLLLIFIFYTGNSYASDKIAYININHILNNSKVGQSISKHIQEIKQKKIDEFKLIEKQLSIKKKDLDTKKNIIEKKEFDNEVNQLNQEIAKYRNDKKKFSNEIDNKKMKYTKIVLNSLNPIISKYVEDNSITIVFPKKSIIIAKKNLDITSPVMDLLDSQLEKIDF